MLCLYEHGVPYAAARLGHSASHLNVYCPTARDLHYARWVSEMTHIKDTAMPVLPKTVKEVQGLFAQHRSVLLLDSGTPVAHGAVTFEYQHQRFVEIGSILVDPNHRRRGYGSEIARRAIGLASSRYPEWHRFALCNSASLPLFLNIGGRIVGFDSIPQEAVAACSECPNFLRARSQGKVCCDTPVNLDAVTTLVR